MKTLLAALLGLAVGGCAKETYTITVYENNVEKTRIGVHTHLDETMIVIRDNETGVWAAVPGSVVKNRLYPAPTTRPAD